MALIITPAEIAAATNVSATEQDVQTAQDVVEVFCGRSINDTEIVAEIGAGDLRRIRLAVQWQVVYLAAHPDALTREVVKRASANGASIEREGDGILSPLAARYLRACSWVAGAAGLDVATLRPALPYRRVQPDPWVRVG